MPSTEIELDHRDKSLDRVFDVGHREEGFGVCHETVGDRLGDEHGWFSRGQELTWLFFPALISPRE